MFRVRKFSGLGAKECTCYSLELRKGLEFRILGSGFGFRAEKLGIMGMVSVWMTRYLEQTR